MTREFKVQISQSFSEYKTSELYYAKKNTWMPRYLASLLRKYNGGIINAYHEGFSQTVHKNFHKYLYLFSPIDVCVDVL